MKAIDARNSVRLPTMRGVIERRILVNFRVDPKAIEKVLPPPFEPKLVDGYAIAGVCLIRLGKLRPVFVGPRCGARSENAAHRIAVTWDSEEGPREGVYIPRRDTDSRLVTLAGGRIFPGWHHHADFHAEETDDRFSVCMRSRDGAAHVRVEARLTDELPEGSVFGSLDEASAFFEQGSVGCSATLREGRYDALELRCHDWRVAPLIVDRVESSFFDDRDVFPPGSVAPDCALLMREIEHEWRRLDDVCCATGEPASAACSTDP